MFGSWVKNSKLCVSKEQKNKRTKEQKIIISTEIPEFELLNYFNGQFLRHFTSVHVESLSMSSQSDSEVFEEEFESLALVPVNRHLINMSSASYARPSSVGPSSADPSSARPSSVSFESDKDESECEEEIISKKRGRPVKAVIVSPSVAPPYNQRKKKPKQYVGVFSKKISHLCSKASSLLSQDVNNNEITNGLQEEMNKIGDAELINMLARLNQLNEEALRDENSTTAHVLLTVNEPHIREIFNGFSESPTKDIRDEFKKVSDKHSKLLDSLRIANESLILLKFYIDKRSSLISGGALVKKVIIATISKRLNNSL